MDDTCADYLYYNTWGESSTEVFCEEKRKDQEEQWETEDAQSIAQSVCGGGLTVLSEEGEYAAISLQFYGGKNTPKRQQVGKAWIQSNKRGVLKNVYNANGMWWQAFGGKGETFQPCFSRDTADQATKGIMDWVNIDNSIGVYPP